MEFFIFIRLISNSCIVIYEYFCNVFYSYLMGIVLRGYVNVCLRVAVRCVCVCVRARTYMCSDLLVWFLFPLNFCLFSSLNLLLKMLLKYLM